MKDNQTYLMALAMWGLDSQLLKTSEELGELQTAIAKYQLAKHYNELNESLRKDVIEELADVLIMCRQIQIGIGEAEVESMIYTKLERVKSWIRRDALPLGKMVQQEEDDPEAEENGG